MKCFPGQQGGSSGEGASGAGVTSTLLLALLSWCLSRLLPSGGEQQLDLGPRPTLDSGQGQCEVERMEDFQVHCGVALNVFTAWKPDDLFALAAIFRKTNEIAIALRCRPEEYPIKAVYGGGGYNAETSLQILQAYLYELQLARIVPDETRFNVTLQTHLGPTALDLENPAYDLLSHGSPAPPDQRTRTPPQRTLDTTTRTIKSTMERIGAQAAPVIMALRPLHEFALLWSQFSLNQTDPKFSVRNAYKDSVRLEPWLIDPENVKASMLTFRRSRIAMYQGNGHFEEMGRFFAEQIRNATGSDSLLDNVRRLEEIFVTWPKQFLVVDRDGILSNERPQRWPLFDRSVQPEVFIRLSRLPELHHIVSETILARNRPIIERNRDQIEQFIGGNHPAERELLESEFRAIQTLLRNRYVDSTSGNYRHFRYRAKELGKRLSDLLARKLGGTTYTWVANLPQDLLEVWSRLAWLDNSVVPADNLLMPFCLALRTNQVYKSFVKVNYAGRDPRTDRYAWPEATAGSTGSVWFTNASASTAEPDSDTSPWLSKADYREHRMKLDLKALYFDAWAPLPL